MLNLLFHGTCDHRPIPGKRPLREVLNPRLVSHIETGLLVVSNINNQRLDLDYVPSSRETIRIDLPD